MSSEKFLKEAEKRVPYLIEGLKAMYPDADCTLDYKNPFELLVATRLAAQCTDARVNIVTPALFARFPDAEAFSKADVAEIEELIKSTGFYHAKAKSISECSKMLIERYNSKVPDNMEDLTSLPGVGRKTANLILGDIYGKPSYVVDTHCTRLTNRMGLTTEKEPGRIEADLRKILPPEESTDFCHRLVDHGRALCRAGKPACDKCLLSENCLFASKNKA